MAVGSGSCSDIPCAGKPECRIPSRSVQLDERLPAGIGCDKYEPHLSSIRQDSDSDGPEDPAIRPEVFVLIWIDHLAFQIGLPMAEGRLFWKHDHLQDMVLGGVASQA